MDDLEEMMMMEAIRLSLASEEERRRREEKEAKKEAKKKSKEEKKAEKVAKKSGIYPSSANQSAATLDSPQSGTFSISSAKGKEIRRDGPSRSSDADGPQAGLSKSAPFGNSVAENAQLHLERSRAQLTPTDAMQPLSSSTSPAYKPSHLRNLSNVSSSASSIAESLPGSHRLASQTSLEPSPNASGIHIPRPDVNDAFPSATPPGGGAGMEPMFNFSSLAAMIGKDEKAEERSSAEHAEFAGNSQPRHGHQRGESSKDVVGFEEGGSWMGNEGSASASGGSRALDENEKPANGGDGRVDGVEVTRRGEYEMGSKEREMQAMNNEDGRRETGSV